VAAELSDTAGKDVFEVTVLSVKDELDAITVTVGGKRLDLSSNRHLPAL